MDNLSEDAKEDLSRFPPIMRRQFLEVFYGDKIGLQDIRPHFVIPVKFCPEDVCTYEYYYLMCIPFASISLRWEIIFDPEDLRFAPDFNFKDHNVSVPTDLSQLRQVLPSWANWNIANPKSLNAVIRDFLSLMQSQNLESLQAVPEYAWLYSDYVKLVEKIDKKNVEMYFDGARVHFLIRLKIDCSGLPQYRQKTHILHEFLNPGDDASFLRLSYASPQRSSANFSLHYCPRIEQVMEYKLYNRPEPTNTLSEYVDYATKEIQDQIKETEQQCIKKKKFLTTLVAFYRNTMLEFDSETFSMALFLVSVEDNLFVVHVQIDNHFPEFAPSLTLHHVSYHPFNKFKGVLYTYNSQWSEETLLQKINYGIRTGAKICLKQLVVRPLVDHTYCVY